MHIALHPVFAALALLIAAHVHYRMPPRLPLSHKKYRRRGGSFSSFRSQVYENSEAEAVVLEEVPEEPPPEDDQFSDPSLIK